MSRIRNLGSILLVIGAFAHPAAADDNDKVPVTAGHSSEPRADPRLVRLQGL